jgi:transglutaminase-like putative cysteine protease
MDKSNVTRWWDLPAAGLLLAALMTAAIRLEATNWTKNLDLPQTLTLLGLIAGLALGYSRFSPRLSAFFAIAYGAFSVPWQVGLTLGRGITWNERLASIAGRLNVIIGQIIHQEIVQDSLLFVVLMAALFWTLSVYAGYTLTRYGDAWRAILPAGLALFVIHSFDAVIVRRAWYLAVYIFFSLVLVARAAYMQHNKRWRQSRTALPPHLGLDFIRFALLLTAVIVLFSWTFPALANSLPTAEKVYQRIRQPWNEVRDRMDFAFASLRATVGVVSDYYGSSLMLGSGNRLTDSLVFIVQPQEPAPRGVRYYWRARTYDTYENGQWRSTIQNSEDFNPQEDQFIPTAEEGRWINTFDFLPQSTVSTLFTPPQPTWVSRPSKAFFTMLPGGQVDISTLRANPSLSAGEVYRVEASLSNASVAQLEEAGTDYPDWVTQRYLQLPDSVTDRTIDLAYQITAGLETPYEKATAITTWLRQNIDYSEVVPNKPTNMESIDWFLFDIRQGFCNYYASAEIVLLRAVGVPARWSVGYAQGEQLDDGTYAVRQRDAHAWPEVYFPDLGWVEFEPTASQPVIVRPRALNNLNQSDNLPPDRDPNLQDQALTEEELAMLRERDRDQAISEAAANQGGIPGWVVAGGSTALAFALLYAAWVTRNRWNFQYIPVTMEKSLQRVGIKPPRFLQLWAQRARLPSLAKSYMEINHALKRLDNKPNVDDTPTERAAALVRTLPSAEEPAWRLVDEYQKWSFSDKPGDENTASLAGVEIRRLSYLAYIKNFFKRLLAKIQRPARKERQWPRPERM